MNAREFIEKMKDADYRADYSIIFENNKLILIARRKEQWR